MKSKLVLNIREPLVFQNFVRGEKDCIGRSQSAQILVFRLFLGLVYYITLTFFILIWELIVLQNFVRREKDYIFRAQFSTSFGCTKFYHFCVLCVLNLTFLVLIWELLVSQNCVEWKMILFVEHNSAKFQFFEIWFLSGLVYILTAQNCAPSTIFRVVLKY